MAPAKRISTPPRKRPRMDAGPQASLSASFAAGAAAAVPPVSSQVPKFEDWVEQVIASSSRSYYAERKNPWFKSLYDRVASCKQDPQVSEFETAEGIDISKHYYWVNNPKEVCDKFRTYLTKNPPRPGDAKVDDLPGISAEASTDPKVEHAAVAETVPTTVPDSEEAQAAPADIAEAETVPMEVSAVSDPEEKAVAQSSHVMEEKQPEALDKTMSPDLAREAAVPGDLSNDADIIGFTKAGFEEIMEDVDLLVAAAKKHSRFEAYIRHALTSYDLQEIDNWQFGDAETSDPDEDLQDFVRWVEESATLQKDGHQESSVKEASRLSECRVVADIETTTAMKHGHVPILHPNWPDKPLDAGGEYCEFQNDAAFLITGIQDTSSIQPPKIPCPKVKSEDWTLEMQSAQSEQPGPCLATQPEQSAQSEQPGPCLATQPEQSEQFSSSLETPAASTPVAASASPSQTVSLHNFDDSIRESFLCSMPSPAESEVGSRPPALDEQSGRCSQEAAAKYLAHQLASYPEVEDMYFSSARVLAALVLKHHAETEQSDVYRNLRTHMGPLSVASICTGTAAFESCMQAATECLYDTFGMANQASDFTEAKFAAESVQFKRDYGMVCLPKECCMYKDATVLLDDVKRSCFVHERNCHLPSSIDAFGAGFSCTSYSLLNKDAGKNATAMEKAMRNKEDPEGKVASVNTFAACCDVLKTSSPAWALFENVTSIDREVDPETKTNLEHCLAQIEALGYSCESFVLDAAWYGLPQGRKRIYLVCFSLTRQDISVSAETFFGNIKKLLTKLYIKPPAVDKFLYDDSDDHVIGYLNHLKAERAQKMTKDAEAPEKNVSWVSMHMTLAAKRDISWPLKIPEPIKTSPWFGVLTDRAKEVVGFAEDERSRMGRPIQFADIYHSANRYGHGDDLVPIILPRTQCWSFSRQRLLLGSELLQLQGQVPAEGAWSQTHYTDLAGNAFAGNDISALIMAILSSLRFSTESEQEENSEIEQMVSALTARGQCEDEDLEPIPTP